MPDVAIHGTKQEQQAFTEAFRHYEMAKEDLQVRTTDFDKKDTLFRSHINEKDWPYRSVVFDPRVFTAIFEKTSRILANKPRGRLVPREGGDTLKAKICNELLSFQWDDNERVGNMPMLGKWALLDMNARKYGASFGLAKWRWQREMRVSPGKEGKVDGKPVTTFDGPDFTVLNNRDVLANPSYSTIRHWFQYREYVTFQELENTNDAARTAPIYKNLEVLRDLLKREGKKGGDTRESNYQSRNKSIKGLTDYLGQDETFRTIELVTEYRPDRWIVFSPKHGLVLRDIPNPYKHGQIPVVMLKYYPIDDDLYGLSEIEPVERLQKAVNALINQYLDAVNMSLYAPLKINPQNVQMHTLEFGPGKKWLMNDPSKDVMTHDQQITGVSEFTSTYRFMISAMQEALGETSVGISNLNPGESGKTATEVKDLAVSRSARDNFNQLYLTEALKKQMLFWHAMDQQFLFSDPAEQQKVIRIVGKDALQYFQEQGLDGEGLTDDGIELLSNPDLDTSNLDPQEFQQPLYPVNVDGETLPKFTMDDDGQAGTMILEPDDLEGTYDYIPDVESMKLPDSEQLIAAKKQMVELALNPATSQLMMTPDGSGYRIKVKEVLEDFFEQLGMKDADKYFEKLQPMQPTMMGGTVDAQGNPIPAGAGGAQAGGVGLGNGGAPGVQGGFPPLANRQAQPVVS